MAKFSKQFAIISKIKSLVKKTGRTIFRTKQDHLITEEVARKIQKTAYDLSHQTKKEGRTPPYLSIAEQLQVEEDQIFRAAAFSLASIAKNEKKNAEDIVSFLTKAASDTTRNTEQKEYINSKIREIQKHHGFMEK